MFKKSVNWTVIIFSVCLMAFIGCTEEIDEPIEEDQELGVEEVYRPLLHHFGSTGCTGCGTFGAPLVHNVGDAMGDSVIPLITHFKYNDPFITESSEAIQMGIVNSQYSPQIWLNDDDITFDIIRLGLSGAEVETKKRLRELRSLNAKAYLNMEYTLKSNQRFDINWVIQNTTDQLDSFYVEIYTMEDGPVASQAGAVPYVATHYKVNRGGHYGDMGKKIVLEPGQIIREAVEVIPCWGCAASEELYFYIIIWQKNSNGKYSYVNGKVLK